MLVSIREYTRVGGNGVINSPRGQVVINICDAIHLQQPQAKRENAAEYVVPSWTGSVSSSTDIYR